MVFTLQTMYRRAKTMNLIEKIIAFIVANIMIWGGIWLIEWSFQTFGIKGPLIIVIELVILVLIWMMDK